MRRLVAFLVVLLASCVHRVPMEVGGRMDVALNTLEGAAWSFEAVRGKVVLVDVWASWCGPCRQSMPFYEDLATAWKARGFEFVGITVDEDERAAKAFLRQEELALFTLHDPGANVVSGRYKVTRMPTAFLLDRTGTIRLAVEGFTAGDKQRIKDELEKLLAEPVEAPATPSGPVDPASTTPPAPVSPASMQ